MPPRCHLEQDPPAYCRRKPALLCITERLIFIARGASADRALWLLQVAAARLALRCDRPLSVLTNGAARAAVRARELEEGVGVSLPARAGRGRVEARGEG